MKPSRSTLLPLAVLLQLAVAGGAKAQTLCGMDFDPGFVCHGASGRVYVAEVLDDGNGSALYYSDFLRGLVRFDGTSSTSLGMFDAAVFDIHVHDDGQGPALYASGRFNEVDGQTLRFVARWNGTSWQQLGPGLSYSQAFFTGHVDRMVTHDDGSGPALYVLGEFQLPGASSITHVARWDGAAWSPVGTDFPEIPHDALTFDDGTGPALYVGGQSLAIPNAAVVRRWDGVAWTLVGGAPTGSLARVTALAVHDDGSGPKLYAGGKFGTLPSWVIRWTGSAWATVGGPFAGSFSSDLVRDLVSFDDGSGARLVAVGDFVSIANQPVANIATWDGTSWSQPGVVHGAGICGRAEVGTWNNGPVLIVSELFEGISGVAGNGFVFWDGTTWFSDPGGQGMTDEVRVLAVADDGSGPALYAGGIFNFAGAALAKGIAKWNGAVWTDLGSGIDVDSVRTINAIATFDPGTGPAVYAGGRFSSISGITTSNIARLEAGVWSPVGSGLPPVSSQVHALYVYDDGSGSKLYAGGSIPGGGLSPGVVRWTGSAWESVGSGINGTVLDFAVFDDGSGPALYACGNTTNASSQAMAYLARWNGVSWVSMTPSAGFGRLTAMAVFDDGSGPALWVGGETGSFGSVLTKWNGVSWSPTNPPLPSSSPVRDLVVFDDGTGPRLYVGRGAFASIHRWNGSQYDVIPGTERIHSFAVEDSPFGLTLWMGGEFLSAGSLESSRIARWRLQGPGILTSQAGAGTPLTLWNTGLQAGRGYFNVVSVDLCPLGPGQGPWGGLCFNDLQVLVAQLLLPPGALPFRPIPTTSTVLLGSYPLPPGLVFETTVLEVSSGQLGCVAPVRRVTVR